MAERIEGVLIDTRTGYEIKEGDKVRIKLIGATQIVGEYYIGTVVKLVGDFENQMVVSSKRFEGWAYQGEGMNVYIEDVERVQLSKEEKKVRFNIHRKHTCIKHRTVKTYAKSNTWSDEDGYVCFHCMNEYFGKRKKRMKRQAVTAKKEGTGISL